MSSFMFTMPGQPPSWNHMYRMASLRITKRDGTPGSRAFMAKTSVAAKFQDDVRLIVQAARPSTFQPAGLIIVAYDFQLKRDIDCDNVMKAMNDAIAAALEVNDNRFLPVVLSKETGVKNPLTHVRVADASAWVTLLHPR